MKIAVLFLCATLMAFSVSIQKAHADDTYGHCSIIYPGSSDANNYRCADSTAFGISYNGYFYNSRPCFPSAGDALNSMQESTVCTLPDSYGACRIIYPRQLDAGGSHCVDPTAFGVGYNGYFYSNNPCFSDIAAAISAMQNASACQQ